MVEYFYLHRTLCDVLEEMRDCYKSRNFAHLMGLIEEAQSMGNRMEAALGEVNDLPKIQAKFANVRKEYKAAKTELESLKEQVELYKRDIDRLSKEFDGLWSRVNEAKKKDT